MDVLIDILKHLPVRSLVRFKIVSKEWLCLISGPYFAHIQNPRLNPSPVMSYTKLSYGIPPLYDGGTVNGSICLKAQLS